jgi:hypothetical protein
MGYRSTILDKLKNRIPLICALLLLTTCTYNDLKKEDGNFESKGIITGRDLRLCPSPCCGGWDITIDNENYNFYKLPSNSTINLETEKFPLKVKLDWERDSLGCNLIDISRIATDN